MWKQEAAHQDLLLEREKQKHADMQRMLQTMSTHRQELLTHYGQLRGELEQVKAYVSHRSVHPPSSEDMSQENVPVELREERATAVAPPPGRI